MEFKPWKKWKMNIQQEKEGRGAMSEAVRQYAMEYAKEYGEEQKQAGIKQGENYMLYSLVQDGDINPEKAAVRLEITVDELRRQMNEAGYQIPTGA